jgi:tetratricopeptide (TPR) repeat protein
MKITTFIAIAVGAVLTTPASADIKRDKSDCTQFADLDRTIEGCTRLLNNPQFEKQLIPVVYNNRGIAWQYKGDFDRAIADYSEALRLDPRQVRSLANRAGVWNEKGEFEQALADVNEAIRLNPNVLESYYTRALIWWNLHQLDKALADLNEFIRRGGSSLQQASVYNARGLVWRDKGDYDAAIADYTQAIRLDPKVARVYSNRGEAWRLKGDLDRAVADQDEAIRIGLQLGDASTASQQGPLGKTVIATVSLKTQYVLRGDTYRYRDEFEKALADYDQSLRIEPDYIPALTGRGLTFEKMGDLERAHIEFEKAVDSKSQYRSDISASSLETARAHLAALASGVAPPVIPAALGKASSPNTIPTPTVAVPAAVTLPAAHQRRVALVIGESTYQTQPELPNPHHDAEKVAATLRAIGFDTVTLSVNATHQTVIDALRAFADAADQADWAMVYYAGHGIEVNGINYLIPVDAKLAVDRDVEFEAVPLDQIMTAVEGAKKLKLILLDACRNNPFAPAMRRTAIPEAAAGRSTAGGVIGTRSIGRGLADIKVTGATLVVYAAKGGQAALDGEGEDSPFAVAVVQRIATPGVEINKVFRLVRDDVMEASAGRQEPYTYGSLPGNQDFYFVEK